MKIRLTFLIVTILFAMTQISAQRYAVCYEPEEYEFPEESTLCEKHADFEADIEILGGESSELNTSYFQNADVYITGVFHIDSWIWFDNCRLLMAPGASVYIHSAGRLAFWKTDVFACEQRWLGITLGSGTLLSYHSHFEDADYLLRVNQVQGSKLVLVGNIFNRNYIGIRTLQTTPNSSPILNFYSFSGNTFDCTAPLFEKWDENLPDALVSFAGIFTQNAIGTIGQFNATNRFQHLQHGIYAVESSLVINRCEFHNMPLISTTGTDGSGIYSNKSSLRITDNPSNVAGTSGSEFIGNQRAGVLAESTDLHIEDCDFDVEDAYAIFSDKNLGGEFILIQRNRFLQQNGICIYLNRSAASGLENNANRVDYNEFDYEQSNGQAPCISIVANNMATDIFSISGNTHFILTGEEAPYGISFRSNNSDNNYLIDNEIDI